MRSVRLEIAGPAGERARLAAMAASIVGLHALGFGLLLAYAPGHAGLAGTALVAYTLGLRHAFDADHIAAIDNTTRRLRQSGGRPVAVGFFFSLGHASVVLVLTIVVVSVTHTAPHISRSTGFVGATVSGTFLWVIGLLNLLVLLELVRVARRVHGAGVGVPLDLRGPSGLLGRLGIARVLAVVRRSWQMFPVGLLFGLGFDTATEFALLALGAGAVGDGLPTPAILALPVLFAAAMSLMDTLDGVVMAHAYDWALRRPGRRLYYNLVITALSVTVALLVGSVQLLAVAREALDLTGPFWDASAGLDLQVVGYVMAGLFVGTWVVALVAWRVLRLDERWPAEPVSETG